MDLILNNSLRESYILQLSLFAWEQRKFGDGMDLLTGFPFESGKFSDNGINLIRGMNVKRGYLDLSDSLCMKWKSSEGLEKYLLENEDILIQMDGALIGKVMQKSRKVNYQLYLCNELQELEQSLKCLIRILCIKQFKEIF